MKPYTIAGAVLLCLGVAHAQQFSHKEPFPTDNRPISGEEWRLQLVGRLMSLPSPVTNGAVQFHGMGDEAAVDVLKILGAKPSLTTAELQATLDIIHMAFEQPVSIISPVNQKPQTAVFLLQHLTSTITDATIKQRITQEATFLRAVRMPSAQNPSPKKQ